MTDKSNSTSWWYCPTCRWAAEEPGDDCPEHCVATVERKFVAVDALLSDEAATAACGTTVHDSASAVATWRRAIRAAVDAVTGDQA